MLGVEKAIAPFSFPNDELLFLFFSSPKEVIVYPALIYLYIYFFVYMLFICLFCLLARLPKGSERISMKSDENRVHYKATWRPVKMLQWLLFPFVY